MPVVHFADILSFIVRSIHNSLQIEDYIRDARCRETGPLPQGSREDFDHAGIGFGVFDGDSRGV